jgi:hypothetical protein
MPGASSPPGRVTSESRMTMEWFIHQQNLERYRRLLAQTADESERRQILKLLAEEEAKDQQPALPRAGAAA